MAENNMYAKLTIKDYDDVQNLIDDYIHQVKRLEYEDLIDRVSIYAKSEFIYNIFKVLLKDYEVGAVHLDRDYFDEDYESVYSLSIAYDGLILIEPAYNKDHNPYMIDGTAYIFEEDCEQDLIDCALKNEANAILFGFNDKNKSNDDCEVKSCEKEGLDENDYPIKHFEFEMDEDTHSINGFTCRREYPDGHSYTHFYFSQPLSEKSIKKILDYVLD